MPPLKIAVNARLLLKDRLEGIGWFAFETLKRITAAHPSTEFIFLFDRPFSNDFIFGPNVLPVVLAPQARHPVLFRIWFDLSVARYLNRGDFDLFISPDGYLSQRTEVPQLAVIHDLNFEHRPLDLSGVNRRYYQKYFPRFAQKAARIATVSEFSRNDIALTYGVNPNKIDVVYNGVSDRFVPLTAEQKTVVRVRYTADERYFLFVGSLHPRKNLQNLFSAFDQFKTVTGSSMKLVVAGAKFRWSSEIERAYTGMLHRTSVNFTGRLSQDALADITAAAEALVVVSYFEGFCVPLIEAFKCGTPVITADRTAMPEVAGGAALLCNPDDPNQIAAAMQSITSNPALAAEMAEKGLVRSKDFSWDHSAALLWDSVMKTLSNDAK